MRMLTENGLVLCQASQCSRLLEEEHHIPAFFTFLLVKDFRSYSHLERTKKAQRAAPMHPRRLQNSF